MMKPPKHFRKLNPIMVVNQRGFSESIAQNTTDECLLRMLVQWLTKCHT